MKAGPHLLLASFCCWYCAGQSVLLVPGSTIPRVQLTGERFQIFSQGKYFTALTAGRSLSQYGIIGADLGFPVVLSDKIVFLFGDNLAAYTLTSGGAYLLASGSGADDSIGYIPNVDLSQCHYIADVDQQLSLGNASPSVGFGGCPAMRFYKNPHPRPTDHLFNTTAISGLLPGEGMGPFQIPVGAFVHRDRLYMFYDVRYQTGQPYFALESVMARSDQSPSTWSDASPPTFTRLYTVSSHPPIADPSHLPPQAGDFGKFIFTPPVVMDAAVLSGGGFASGLPPALQGASKVVFVFGSSWAYARSNLYLAAFSIDDVEAGTSKWFYYAGQKGGSNVWSNDERAAAPLLPDPIGIGNHSVIWNPALGRFILMYRNVLVRFSATPWGPWTDPVSVFDFQSAWGKKLIHHPGVDQITRSVDPIYNTSGSSPVDLGNVAGVPYGPNLIDQFTQNPDGSVTVYFGMSTWNPYEVFLMSSTFQFGPQPGSVKSAASYDASAISPDSIATLFGAALSDAVYAAPTDASLPTSLGGTSVMVIDSAGVSRAALLSYVSPGQINFVVPSGSAAGPATVKVLHGSSLVGSATTIVTSVAPGLFTANATGTGAPYALFLSIGTGSTQLTYSCDAAPGSCVPQPFDLSTSPAGAYLELYGTGIRNNSGLDSVTVTIGGIPATVTYAGPQGQYPGLDQVNVLLPSGLQGKGEVEVQLLVDGGPANTVRVAFQ